MKLVILTKSLIVIDTRRPGRRLAGIVIVEQTQINTKHRGLANINQEMFALNRQNPASSSLRLSLNIIHFLSAI